MPVTLYQSDGTLVPPVADARLYEMLSGGAVGIVQGCEITSLGGNQLQITSGWGVCLGRVFSVEQEVINASTSPSGEVDGRLIIAIDVSSGGTPIAFVTQAETPLPALVQEDINQDGTIYQIPMATYSINELAVSDLKTVYPKADVSGVGVYTHTRSGTVNELTGAGPNGRALMTADVQPGDTWKVNGQPVTAYMGTEDATDSMAGQPYNGKWVTFVVEGATLNFKGGNGLSPDDQSKLIPKNILNGVTFFEGTPKEVIGSLKILAAGGANASGYYVFWDGEKYQNGIFGVSTPSFNFVGTPMMAVVNMQPESKAVLTICGVPVTGNSQAQVLTELSGTEIAVTTYAAEFYCGFAVLGYN